MMSSAVRDKAEGFWQVPCLPLLSGVVPRSLTGGCSKV
jgi:hypothetical protein